MTLLVGVPASYRTPSIQEYCDNPLIESLPDICTESQAASAMLIRPQFDPRERLFPAEHRWHLLARLKHIVVPRPKYYFIERTISRLIRAGYVLRNPLEAETWRRVYGARMRPPESSTVTNDSARFFHAESKCTIVGLSGIGKTTAVDAVLRVYPDQVIRHETYRDHRLPLTQIVWLKVTCPENGSISSFCREFARQLDRTLGVDKYERMYTRSKLTRDELEGMMRQHSATYFLGLLVIDEIQRLDLAKTHGAAPLLDFFQDLRDLLKVPILLIGTYKAVKLFTGGLKDARRASESGLIDLERPSSHRDDEWARFVRRLWAYQWVQHPIPLTDELLHGLFDLTQGVTDVLVILFKLAQQRAMEAGTEVIDLACMRSTYDEQLTLLHPAINALRENTYASLSKFEDLLPPNRELIGQTVPAHADINVEAKIDQLLAHDSAAMPNQQEMAVNHASRARKDVSKREALAPSDLRSAATTPDAYQSLRESGVIGDDFLSSTHGSGTDHTQ
ncbi:ATP-binding protein [Paraburkholderia tropica]|uniref:ATP-binding protein n=1 Tax=Paraburkholderia tropica TaxID=92647 RepID=UPI001CC5F14D|nr:ATP-binding protein [Paraburkholderia tropica]